MDICEYTGRQARVKGGAGQDDLATRESLRTGGSSLRQESARLARLPRGPLPPHFWVGDLSLLALSGGATFPLARLGGAAAFYLLFDKYIEEGGMEAVPRQGEGSTTQGESSTTQKGRGGKHYRP